MPAAVMAQAGGFPRAEAAQGEWDQFVLQSFRLSALVVLVGILVSIVTLVVICRVHIRAHHQTKPCLIFSLLLLANMAVFGGTGLHQSFSCWFQAAELVKDLSVELEDVQVPWRPFAQVGLAGLYTILELQQLYTLGIPSDVEALDDDLCVDGERLEDNEELRLHDKQLQYELARGYKDHIDAVKADRQLEEWMQDMALP
eukprot:s810_g20.t1